MKKHNKPYLSVAILSMMAIFCLVVTLALLGCSDEFEDAVNNDHGFLNVALVWEDKIDSTDEIESVNLWVYDKTGALSIDKKFNSALELALQEYELAAGNYVVVIGVNVTDPIEANQITTSEDLKEELARQAQLYEQTYYGDKTAEVVAGESRGVYVPLHDKPQNDNSLCERCNAENPEAEHNYLCGIHSCVEGIVADEHKAESCGTEGHFVCDEKDHTTKLDCEHFACADGEHGKLGCGHYACADGEHEKLGCGHYACQRGNHTTMFDCGHYTCQGGAHEKLDCGHFACYSNGDHSKLDCGHFACYREGDHVKLDCGHYVCKSTGNHSKLGCGHFACAGGYHNKLNCGHFTCDEDFGDKSHSTQPCGHYLCLGAHSTLNCGHFGCEEGNHSDKLDCGHLACTDGEHGKLQCGHYACLEGSHFGLACGHYACADGQHGRLACGHDSCDGNDHTKLDCGHTACTEGDHSMLDCGHYECGDEDHIPLDCGHIACDEEYGVQDCGHCLCEGRHYLCRVCSNYNCENREIPHEEYYCGHILCGETMEDGHIECEYCYDCITYGTHSESGCEPPPEQ